MIGNESTTLVSVIINCYNGGRYLREAIDSVFAQTYTNWEIIFWDNCSTDDSAEIAKSYGDKVKYHYSYTNTSLGEARNLAIQSSLGEFISFIDCDDIWLPNKLSVQLTIMQKNPDFILCYAGLEEIKDNGEHFRMVLPLYDSGKIFKQLLKQYDVNILTTLIRRQELVNSGLNFDPYIKASEEYCLFMQLAAKYNIGVINLILAKYRVHSMSLTNKSFEWLGTERRYTLDKILNRNQELRIKYPSEFREAYARSFYYDANFYMLIKKRNKAIKKLFHIVHLNYKYLLLFILAFFPYYFWLWVQKIFRNRV